MPSAPTCYPHNGCSRPLSLPHFREPVTHPFPWPTGPVLPPAPAAAPGQGGNGGGCPQSPHVDKERPPCAESRAHLRQPRVRGSPRASPGARPVPWWNCRERGGAGAGKGLEGGDREPMGRRHLQRTSCGSTCQGPARPHPDTWHSRARVSGTTGQLRDPSLPPTGLHCPGRKHDHSTESRSVQKAVRCVAPWLRDTGLSV